MSPELVFLAWELVSMLVKKEISSTLTKMHMERTGELWNTCEVQRISGLDDASTLRWALQKA